MGLLTADEIKAVRRAKNLNQKQCAQLLGGGVNSFHKYESGTVIQSAAMDLLIRVVRDVPGALTYVAEIRGMPEVAEQVGVSAFSPAAMLYGFSTLTKAVVNSISEVKKAERAHARSVINGPHVSFC
jgi:transcriptional regulator with XRE-family HTH domain